MIRCDHQIQTRKGNAVCQCIEKMPLMSFWGNQTGYESQLHCLQQDLDCQDEGNYEGRPHSEHSVPAHSAGMATPKEARAYWDFRDQFATDEGLLLMGPCIVIPSCLQEEYLEKLHQGHLSATKVQQNAHQHLYWPGLDADIIDYTRRCQECIYQSLPSKEPLPAYNVPQQSWECTAMDYFYVNGKLYILICDYFSKFPFIFQVKTTSFANLKDHLQELFAVEFTSDEIMSDNGPSFNGKVFSSFLTGLGIRHTTSSPNYPQANPDGTKAHGESTKHWKEFSGSPDQFESTATVRWFALTSRDTSWEEPCNKKGNLSGCSCCSSVSNCFAGQLHQEL